MALISGWESVGVLLFAILHPAAPAGSSQGSMAWWVVAAVVLALIVASGIVLSSRR